MLADELAPVLAGLPRPPPTTSSLDRCSTRDSTSSTPRCGVACRCRCPRPISTCRWASPPTVPSSRWCGCPRACGSSACRPTRARPRRSSRSRERRLAWWPSGSPRGEPIADDGDRPRVGGPHAARQRHRRSDVGGDAVAGSRDDVGTSARRVASAAPRPTPGACSPFPRPRCDGCWTRNGTGRTGRGATADELMDRFASPRSARFQEPPRRGVGMRLLKPRRRPADRPRTTPLGVVAGMGLAAVPAVDDGRHRRVRTSPVRRPRPEPRRGCALRLCDRRSRGAGAAGIPDPAARPPSAPGPRAARARRGGGRGRRRPRRARARGARHLAGGASAGEGAAAAGIAAGSAAWLARRTGEPRPGRFGLLIGLLGPVLVTALSLRVRGLPSLGSPTNAARWWWLAVIGWGLAAWWSRDPEHG